MHNHDHQLDEMYRDIILDHYRSPRGRKDVADPTVVNEGMNPSCGDEIEMKVRLKGDTVEELGVHCAGCAISVASGSMLSEIAEGRTISELKVIAAAVKGMLTTGEVPEEIELDELSDIEVLEGVRQFPVRIKCALLAWVTLVEGLERYEKGGSGENASTTEDANPTVIV
ncbi:SUF system NifU family Fe-S cluster assembly protein [bacterium]|nr:SUF system NifU family Fe-S cluster assembly protein [bacterium]